MPQYTCQVKANTPFLLGVTGTYFSILETGSAAFVGARVLRNATEVESVRTARRGLQARVRERFTAVELRSTIDTVCEVVVSDGEVEVDSTDGASVLATIANSPLPVVNDRGAPANPVHVVGLTASDAPATAFAEPNAVAVNASLTTLLSASATRRSVRFHNQGANPVAIGGPGVTWAKRAIVLQPGDTWVDDRAANLAWSAVCDTGQSTTVGVQGVNA